MTANQVIYAALRLIRIVRDGQTPSADESAESLAALNVLLENWSTERLNIFAVLSAQYSLVSTTQSYTIGSGGVFNAARPLKIEEAGIIVPNTGGAGNMRFPLTLIGEKDWAAITEKSAAVDVPALLFNDHAYPLSTLYFWPIPTFAAITTKVELSTWQALSAFPDLVTDVGLAPGYSRAMQYALAVEMAPRYGMEIPAGVAAIADQSKAAIRALNASAPDLMAAAAMEGKAQ